MIHRFLFFVFLTAIIFPPSISHSQSGNTHYWPETGASISLPDGWRVLVHDGYELYMTTIPDIDEFPEDPADYEPGQLVAQFEQVRFGSSVPLDADLEQTLDVYAGRTFGVPPQNVELFEIEGREVALLQQIVSVEEARLGVVLAMVAPERPAGLYRLIAIGHHPSDDPAPYVELARQWTAEAFFPEGNLLPPGEPASAGDLALIVPDGFTLLEFDDGVILTNMDTAIESLQEDMALDDGDILIRIVSMQGEDERPTAEAYAGESNSSFSYRVSTTNISGIFLSTEDAIREIHVPRRPAWSNTPFTLLDVNAVGYSDAELRTLLRPIIAGMTLGWLPDTSQTISIGDYQLGIPAHWEPTTLDRFPEMIFFEESRVFDAAFEEANPGDVVYGFMPDAVSALNLDTAGDNLQQQAVEAFMPNFGTEQVYTRRTIEVNSLEILAADISALEDRSGPRKYFGQIYVLPPNDNGTMPLLALNYEARIDYATEIQPFVYTLLSQIISQR